MKMVLKQQFTPKIMFDKNKAFKVDPKNPTEVNVDINFDISVSYKPNPNKKNEYLVELQLAWRDIKSPILLDVVTCGVFQLYVEENNGEIDGEALDRVLRVGGAEALFPYLRERVSGITSHGGLPPVFLPPIDFEQLYLGTQKRPTLQ